MSTSEALRAAWLAVVEADLPEEMHQTAFREAMRLNRPHGPSTNTEDAPAQGRHTEIDGKVNGDGATAQTKNTVTGAISVPEAELVRRVADGTGIKQSALNDLIYLDDGALRLTVPGLKLGKNNADRSRAIATLFTVVRSFGLDEDDTSLELIRDEAQRLKCYDSANFSSQMKGLQGFVVKGTGANRRVQAKSSGIQAFINLVERLEGE